MEYRIQEGMSGGKFTVHSVLRSHLQLPWPLPEDERALVGSSDSTFLLLQSIAPSNNSYDVIVTQ